MREIDGASLSPSREKRMNSHVSRRITAGAVSALLCAFFSSGCGNTPEGPNTVPVSGTVTYQGQPLDGANVVFYPTDGSTTLASQAVTDASGRFELTTHIGVGKFKPGIVPGKYAVAITKLDTAGISSTLTAPKDLLPKKYGDPKTSGLAAEVDAQQENDVTFALGNQ